MGEIDRIILNDADFINEITAIDSKESIWKMFNEFAREIERAVEADVKVSFAEGVQEDL